MPWYGYLFLACVVIAPFDALYLYVKAGKRRAGKRDGDGGKPRA